MHNEGPVLLLTNNSNVEPFSNWLQSVEKNVVIVSEPLTIKLMESIKPVFTLSFNYRHIVKPEVIECARGSIANVHCSVLPYNRGASPNFFSYYENTPKGVTVHEMTSGLDKGAILLQRALDLGEDETFASSYSQLIREAIVLLQDNWQELKTRRCDARPQMGIGSYHTTVDFKRAKERFPFEWGDRICDWKRKYGLV